MEKQGRRLGSARSAAVDTFRQSPGWDRQALEAKFEAASPAIGAPLPDLSAYDAEGLEFKLSSLKGNYSVLVLGCLT